MARPLADDLVPGAREHYDDAGYYDFTYRTRRDDVAYYQRAARQVGGPVLEIGGGSGRVALALAHDGADVTVLDVSRAMLAQGRRNARERLPVANRNRVSFVRADMRRFALGATFPLVIAPFNVLQHLYEPSDFEACFRAVRAHLAPGGRFVFDVRAPNLRELLRAPDRAYRSRGFVHPTLGHRIEYVESFRYDPIKQVQHVTIRFEPGADAPGGTAPFETVLSQRQIFPNELRALLALGGLTLAARHGSFEGRPFAEDDPQMIVWSRGA